MSHPPYRRPTLRLERLEDRDQPSGVFAIDSSGGNLIRFDTQSPGTTLTIPVGVGVGETLRGIDFRPATGQLYGLAVNGLIARVGTINISTGTFTAVGIPIAVTGANFGMDFNPAIDRIRIVSDADENFVVNPNDGTVVVQTALNPATVNVVASAYDRNFTGTGATTLFGIDTASDRLVLQGSVNGTPNNPSTGIITDIGTGLGVGDVTDASFDVRPDGFAFASLTVGGTTRFYTVDLTAGTAALVGTIGTGAAVNGIAVAPLSRIAVGIGNGEAPRVRFYDGESGDLIHSFLAYNVGFRNGVNVATGDVDGNGILDIITGAGPGGGPHVRIFHGVTGNLIRGFFAYNAGFRGGVNVASADVNGDGFDDIITGAGPGGGPHVRVFSGRDGTPLASFFPYAMTFKGGVNVAAGDLDLVGGGTTAFKAEIVTGAGAGGGAHVRVFDGTGAPAPVGLTSSFFAYASTFKGGVYVATGDVNGDGRMDIVTGAGAGGSPHVRAFRATDASSLASFFAYETAFRGGARVAASDVNGDGRVEIVTGPGFGRDTDVRAFVPSSGILLEDFTFDPISRAGIFVGGGRF